MVCSFSPTAEYIPLTSSGAVIQLQKGDILGHEFCGKVDSVGPGVKNLKPGDRVVASFQIACGECMYCQKKLSSQCERTNTNKVENIMYGGRTAGMFGYSHFTGGFAGGQAEYARVPYGDVNLLPLPDDVPDEKGLYLSDVLSTSWNCVVDTGVKEGDVVAIWGAGPIGQMCAEMSFIRGAKRVIVIDGGPAAWRLDLVKSKTPKVETLNYTDLPRGETVTSKLKEMEHGGPDVALECAAGEYAKGIGHKIELALGLETDTSEIINEMITSVKSYGRCGITGVYVGFVSHSLLLIPIGALLTWLLDQPLQHRRPDGTRYPTHRQRSSTGPSLLEGSPQDDPGRQPRLQHHAQSPRQHGRNGHPLPEIRCAGGQSPEGVCADEVLGPACSWDTGVNELEMKDKDGMS